MFFFQNTVAVIFCRTHISMVSMGTQAFVFRRWAWFRVGYKVRKTIDAAWIICIFSKNSNLYLTFRFGFNLDLMFTFNI